MTNKLDYSNEAVLDILNNSNYTEDQKKELFEKYKKDLQKNRKEAIVAKLNELAKDIPSITKEDYIECLKKYENDDLTKPFEVIEEELKIFEQTNKQKYEEYLKAQEVVEEPKAQPETPIIPEEPVVPEVPVIEETPSEEITPDITPSTPVTPEESADDKFDDTIFKSPEDFKNDITPSTFIENNEVSVLNEEPEAVAKSLFQDTEDDGKDVMPDEIVNDGIGEKGNASAIILSIIAIIIGILVMYSIIKLK